jgi:hypothetical protein
MYDSARTDEEVGGGPDVGTAAGPSTDGATNVCDEGIGCAAGATWTIEEEEDDDDMDDRPLSWTDMCAVKEAEESRGRTAKVTRLRDRADARMPAPFAAAATRARRPAPLAWVDGVGTGDAGG